MPELPDVELYVEAIRARLSGRSLRGVRLVSPFVLRTVEPPLASFVGLSLVAATRLGKRVVLGFSDGHEPPGRFIAIHLMIAGRLRLLPTAGPQAEGAALARLPGRIGLAAFDFGDADPLSLVLTEAGSRRRASIHAAANLDALAALDPGGIEPLEATPDAFARALRADNHTLKRALTDPRILAGIGNAYSDEILHHARLSPLQWTSRLADDEMARLYEATRAVLTDWLTRLRAEVARTTAEAARPRRGRAAAARVPGWPEQVTAFREGMAVHGRYREPCPRCDAPIQRIVRGKHEVNYCALCQTGGRVLADRALSRLLGSDWPKTLEELEELRRR